MIAKAKELKIQIVVHIEGMARRDRRANERSINAISSFLTLL